MSTRALVKLLKKEESYRIACKAEEVLDDISSNAEELSDECSSGDDIAKSTNKFDLLTAELESESENEEKPIEIEDNISAGKVQELVVPPTGARKKKKRKKQSRFPGKRHGGIEEGDDEVERSLREVNALLGEVKIAQKLNKTEKNGKHLLSIEHKHLNPQNEMKRIFGARVVEDNQRRQQRTPPGARRNYGSFIVQKPPPIAQHRRPAISMILSESKSDFKVFKFQHLPSYQKAQLKFIKNANTINPESLLALLNEEPYHVDTLLQVSEIFRLADDSPMAAQLIERAIYILESSMHPLFNYTTANSRLEFKQQENRALFIAIFRHILNVSQKGCYRTALELSKLLLNLSPDDDPLAVSLMLDFFALRAQEYAWLISLYDHYTPTKNLSMLPNFSFSVPLALYHLSNGTSRSKQGKCQYHIMDLSASELRQRADVMIQEALIMFPGVLMPLLDKCSIQPDPVVKSHPYFGPKSQESMNKALTQLANLFVGRNYHSWKEAAIMEWLEGNVRQVIQRVDAGDVLVKECEKKRENRYLGMPHAIYRHIFMAEVKDVTISLPPSLSGTDIMSYDPLPPIDSVCDYSFPKTQRRSGESSDLISSFFRSFLPNYNPDALANLNLLNEVEGAEGVEVGGELRASVHNLLEAMRDLFANIHLAPHPQDENFPVDLDDNDNQDDLPPP